MKPTDKKQTLPDGGGLSLVVATSGGKYWQYNYRLNGKQKTLRIGTYPDVPLVKAREKHKEARQMVAEGQDPAAAKQEAKQAVKAAKLSTFYAVALEWHSKQLHRWKPLHAARVMRHLEVDVFPNIGSLPVHEVGIKDVKAVTEQIIGRGAIETADKVRQWIGAVFDYAALLEMVSGNPATPLRAIMPKQKTAHMAALPREEVTEFYRRLIPADTDRANKIGLLLIMLVFVRNKELRGGKWAEIDWQAKEWHIPAERMKRPRPHIVPLADWTLELLAELHDITGQGEYLFPSRSRAGYISENTLGKIMNNMGYKGIAVPHGFRSLASSLLNEQGFNRDAVERQLAHVEGDKVRAAYNRAEYLPQRHEMMQWYSDWLRARFDAAVAALKAG